MTATGTFAFLQDFFGFLRNLSREMKAKRKLYGQKFQCDQMSTMTRLALSNVEQCPGSTKDAGEGIECVINRPVVIRQFVFGSLESKEFFLLFLREHCCAIAGCSFKLELTQQAINRRARVMEFMKPPKMFELRESFQRRIEWRFGRRSSVMDFVAWCMENLNNNDEVQLLRNFKLNLNSGLPGETCQR